MHKWFQHFWGYTINSLFLFLISITKELINRKVFIPLVNKVIEPGFATWRFRQVQEDEQEAREHLRRGTIPPTVRVGRIMGMIQEEEYLKNKYGEEPPKSKEDIEKEWNWHWLVMVKFIKNLNFMVMEHGHQQQKFGVNY